MAVLCFSLILFTNILIQNGLNANIIPTKTQSAEEFEYVLYKLSNNTVLEEQFYSNESNAVCKCTNGLCVKKNGKEICQCPPEFGYISPNLCKACECGKGANCTFESSGWFSNKKTCICPYGYLADGEKCKEMDESTPSTNSDSSFGTMTTLPSTTRENEMSSSTTNTVSSTLSTTISSTTIECDCGKYATDCRISWWQGGKICDCFSGYIQKNGICEAIQSRPTSPATTHVSRTETPYVTSIECNCGKFSKNCRVSFWEGKVCECMLGYTQKDGICVATELSSPSPATIYVTSTVSPYTTLRECDCGKYSKSCRNSFWEGKVCDCMLGYVQKNGICVAIETTPPSPVTSTNIRTTIPVRVSTTPVFSTTLECDCGKYSTGCRHSWFGKVCSCLDGYIQRNGTCAKCYCGKYAKGCTLKENVKKCICRKGYSERYGICTECNCGENSLDCSFYRNGTKKCDCPDRYSQRKGTCLATCFGPDDCSNGTVCMRAEGGKYFCECPPNFRGPMCKISTLCEKLESSCQAMGAVCVLKDSNAYCSCPRGEKMNFKKGLCESICNPDKCLHGKCKVTGKDYKCSCDEGYTGLRCEEKIKPAAGNSLLWLIIFLTVLIFICIMQFGMFCLLCSKRK